MIRWAVDHPDLFPDHRVMHAGALLATFSFVGSVAELLGRSFALDEPVTIVDLTRRAVAVWGASSTVHEGVGKTITTLRRLDVVQGWRPHAGHAGASAAGDAAGRRVAGSCHHAHPPGGGPRRP